VDLLAAAAVTAARRAGEFADAIESRGGAVSTAEPPTPLSYRDAVLGAVVLATIAAGILAGAWLV
jgi:energy-coupling factor transporter transmembrane protein EcfT